MEERNQKICAFKKLESEDLSSEDRYESGGHLLNLTHGKKVNKRFSQNVVLLL